MHQRSRHLPCGLAICATLCLDFAGAAAAQELDLAAPTDPETAAAVVAGVSDARVVIIEGDDPDRMEVLHRTRTLLLGELSAAGFNLLVYPVGIFEGWWVDRFLDSDDVLGDEPDLPLYGVWLRSTAFRDQLRQIRATRDTERSMRVIGGLCRFHARGKELYTPHLFGVLEAGGAPLPAVLADGVAAAWGGRERLAHATPEERRAALQIHADVSRHVARHRAALVASLGARRLALEEQFLANMLTFLQLERARGGDIELPHDFGARELGANLLWLVEQDPAVRMIVIAGRGDGFEEPDGLGRVARIRLVPAPVGSGAGE